MLSLQTCFRIALLPVSVAGLRNTRLLEVYVKEVQVQGCAQMSVRWVFVSIDVNIRELVDGAVCPLRTMHHFKPESSLYE